MTSICNPEEECRPPGHHQSTRANGKDTTAVPSRQAMSRHRSLSTHSWELCRYALPRDPRHRANCPEGPYDLPQTGKFPQESGSRHTPQTPNVCLAPLHLLSPSKQLNPSKQQLSSPSHMCRKQGRAAYNGGSKIKAEHQGLCDPRGKIPS